MKERKKGKSVFPLVLFLATFVTLSAVGILLPEKQMSQLINLFDRASNKIVDEAVSNGLTTCRIKGNVSYNSGERIYHVPGQEDYSRTKINLNYDERWFCTEEDAITAGWRKAGR